MATSRLSTGLLLGIALAAVLGSARSAAAGFINGDFSSGLTGWTPSDPSFVSAAGGQATLLESNLDFSVTLSQDVTLGTGDQTLSFQLLAFTTEAETNGGLPDAFNVSLLNPITGESLVPTVPLADLSPSKNYYSRDLVDGVMTGQAASGVTVMGLAGGGEEISINVSSLQGQNVRLMFTLLGGSEFTYNASVNLDGVSVAGQGGGVPGVPAPATVVLLLTGCPGLLGLWVLRRRGGRGPRTVASPA